MVCSGTRRCGRSSRRLGLALVLALLLYTLYNRVRHGLAETA